MRIERPFTVTQDPDYSECFRACVATVFQVPPSELPPMGADIPSDEPVLATDQDKALQSWLNPRGIDFVRISAQRGNGNMLPWGVCIASGTTNRDTHHAVVWDAGWWEDNADDGEMLFDPHPSRDGLERINYFTCFVVREPLRLADFKPEED